MTDLRRLVAANTTSLLGTQVTDLALLLVAISVLHASPAQVGTLAAAEVVAYLVLGLPAGLLVDRVRMRDLLVAADLGRALVVASVPVAAALGALSLPQLYTLVFAASALGVVADVAGQSLVPRLVPSDGLPAAHSRLAAGSSVAQVGGPGLAGVLIQVLGPPLAMAVDAASYVASAALLRGIRADTGPARPPEDPPPSGPAGDRPRRRPGGELLAGLRFLATTPPLPVLVAAVAWYNLASAATGLLLVLLLARDLGLPTTLIGAFYSLAAIGGLVGSAVAGRVAARLGPARALRAGLLVAVAGAALVPLADSGWRLGVAAAGLLVTGAGMVVFNVSQLTLRQRLVPAALLGRTTAAVRLLVTGAVPAGSLVGGLLATALPVRTVLWAAAAAPLLVLPGRSAAARRLPQAGRTATPSPVGQ